MAIQLIGSNLNTYGDGGNFETVYTPGSGGVGSSWGTYFNYPYYGDDFTAIEVSRSNDVPPIAGTYVCKVVNKQVSGIIVLPNFCFFNVTPGKKYRISCWIYVALSAPIATDDSFIVLSNNNGLGGSAVQVNKYQIGNIKNQWRFLELYFTWPSQFVGTECFGTIYIENGQVIENGIIYIDDVRCQEYIEVADPLTISATVTNASGPTASDGSITVTSTGGTGTYEYSKDGGNTYQSSNVFTGLGAGTYSIFVRNNGVLAFRQAAVGVNAPAFDITGVSVTNESATGAADGSVTVNVSGTGSPFQYQLQFESNAPGAWQSSNVFTGLVAGTYFPAVRDTHGNVKFLLTGAVVGLDVNTVCALLFDANATVITNASDAGESDGSFTVKAIDSVNGGVVKYALFNDFDYNTLNSLDNQLTFLYTGPPVPLNTTGTFANLVQGTYQVYARTSTSCLALATVVVGADAPYGVRHRYEFSQIGLARLQQAQNNGSYGNNPQFRLDIEEKGYSGSVDNIAEGSDTNPVVLSYRGEGQQNPFTSRIISSELTFSFISQTDNQYIHLFSSNERKFRARLYVYNPGDTAYNLMWTGFNVPMTWSEPYFKKDRYPVTVTFTDQLRDLDRLPFTDYSGTFPQSRITLIKALSFCLYKTGLFINIHDKVDLLCAGMEAVENKGMLDQALIDPRVYLQADGTALSCLQVLYRLLAGCRLYQARGAWQVELVGQKGRQQLNYRIYSIRGENQVFGGYATERNRVALRRSVPVPTDGPRVSFMERSAVKSVAEQFGKIKVTYKTGIEAENNLLAYGNFEDADLQNGQLKGWQINTVDLNAGKHAYGLEYVARNDESSYAFYTQFNNVHPTSVTVDEQKLILLAEPKQIIYPGYKYGFKLYFSVYARPLFTGVYTYFDYRIQLTKGSAQFLSNPAISGTSTGWAAFSTGAELLSGGWNRLYLDDPLKWTDFVLLGSVADGLSDGSLQVAFRFPSNPIYDTDDSGTVLDSISDLQSLDSTKIAYRTFYNRRKVLDGDIIRFYELEAGLDVANPPEIVRPNNFNAGSNAYVWKLKKSVAKPTIDVNYIENQAGDWLQSILIDNVRLAYFPNEQEPVEEVVLEATVDEDIRPVYEEEIYHGDIYYSATQDLGAQEMDPNYANIMLGHFTLLNGQPTYGGWRRRGVNESRFYQDLLLDMIRGQFTVNSTLGGRVLLTGQLNTQEQLLMFDNTLQEYRSGKILLLMALTMNLRDASANIEALEVLQGTAVDESDPNAPPPDPVEPPVDTAEFSTEFSLEFNA